MKIGWLVWSYSPNEFPDERPELYEDGTEPEYCAKKIRIVYCEVAS